MTGAAVGPAIEGLTFIERLGSGGYSEVFLYEQRKPRMRVAVKVLNGARLTDTELAQFAGEAETMAELADHPFIVQVFNTGTTEDGRPYLVMKYYPPPNLGQRASSERFTVADVLRTGIQISSAVETAHRAGILHRDIKPANILVSQYGDPGLADFGIAGKTAEVDTEGDELGVSIPWAPPEVLTGTSNGTAASDVYSLAATLWHLLAGRSPFEIPGGDNSQRALLGRILRSAPATTGRADVPTALERLLQQAMSKKAEMRPASALDFARSLQMIEQELRYTRTEIVVNGDSTRVPRPVQPPTVAPSSTAWAPPPPPSPRLRDEPTPDIRFAPDQPGFVESNRTTVRPSRPQEPTQASPVAKAAPMPTAPPTPRVGAPSPPTVQRPDRAANAPLAEPAETEGTRVRPTRPVETNVSTSSGTSRSTDVPGASATVRRPTSAPPVAEAEPQSPPVMRKGINAPLASAIAAVVIVAAVVVGIMVMSSGSKTPAVDATTPAPVGTDQGGFGGGGIQPPTVAFKFDIKSHSLRFTWSGTSDVSPAKYVYSLSTGGGTVGPTKATSVSVSTTKPNDVCITVATVVSDGTQKPAAPVCGQ